MTDEELRSLFEEEARLMSEDARVPSAGGVWWRAAMRARADAAAAAVRPMFWFQAIAAAAVIGALVAVVGRMWPAIGHVVDRGAQAMGSWAAALVAIVAVGAIVVPVALYFALSERSSS